MFLPSNEHKFHFSVVGERTKHKYEGAFKVKCLLSAAEQVEVALRADLYNRGSKTLVPTANLINRTIAELELRVLEAPSWWKDSQAGRDMLDTNVLFQLFNQALEAEKVFEDRIVEEQKKAEASIEKATKRERDKAAKAPKTEESSED